ncbi:uncharacterized protein Pyn_11683 [Prunus yedoensis var. nudiflora]|uniref:Uncharacterized protein n=1 Tax=Prunus yedoensis var. nudiflora TaxID=2094558 RepID=A0A314XW58_PRUYE|nr:uncharacterized protein Pyn_11683 [Prunus yedoensis var. nudiflora]
MASSKKWASIISSIASCVYFLVIILQCPLFSVPCTAGICRTPIEFNNVKAADAISELQRLEF